MSTVTETKLSCPLCGKYLKQGDVGGLAKHLQKDCTALDRDGEHALMALSHAHCAPVCIDLAPGGGGYGFYALVGQDADGNCQYVYAGTLSA